jgi:hypothetical protein
MLLPPNSQANEIIALQAKIRSTVYSSPIARSNIYVAPDFDIARGRPIAERWCARSRSQTLLVTEGKDSPSEVSNRWRLKEIMTSIPHRATAFRGDCPSRDRRRSDDRTHRILSVRIRLPSAVAMCQKWLNTCVRMQLQIVPRLRAFPSGRRPKPVGGTSSWRSKAWHSRFVNHHCATGAVVDAVLACGLDSLVRYSVRTPL